jgi:anthranilate phosphoribosyltransferase
VLNGNSNAYRDVAVLNAAAGILVAGKAETLADGVVLAGRSIDTGEAKDRLEKLVRVSNG